MLVGPLDGVFRINVDGIGEALKASFQKVMVVVVAVVMVMMMVIAAMVLIVIMRAEWSLDFSSDGFNGGGGRVDVLLDVKREDWCDVQSPEPYCLHSAPAAATFINPPCPSSLVAAAPNILIIKTAQKRL